MLGIHSSFIGVIVTLIDTMIVTSSGNLAQPPAVRDEGYNHWTRRRSGDISGSVFYRPLPKNKIHCTHFPCLPVDTTVWEMVSLSTVKVLDARYRFLSTYTHTTVSHMVSLSTVKLFPVIEFLQLCAQVVDAMSYPPVQDRVSLFTVKLPCTIKHTLVLI